MEEQFVTRWLVQVDENRFLLYDDEDDIEEADEVLEIRIPGTMAVMLDFTQHSYYTMQVYFEAQWELMQKKLALDSGSEYAAGETSGDDLAFMEQFEAIIKQNNLEDIKPTEEDDK